MTKKALNRHEGPADDHVGGRKEYGVSPEQFIEAWQTSETADEVARRLSMPKPIVLARASTYRKMGLALKEMRRRHKKELDVDALNDLIANINRKHGIEHTVPDHPRARATLPPPSRDVISDAVDKVLKAKARK
jgi:hypothetical protein